MDGFVTRRGEVRLSVHANGSSARRIRTERFRAVALLLGSGAPYPTVRDPIRTTAPPGNSGKGGEIVLIMTSGNEGRGGTQSLSQPRKVVGLGEALWDFLPEGRQIGGAPLNFAYISSLLDGQAAIASRIGTDQLGGELERELTRRGIEIGYLQHDPSLPTGSSKVVISADGQPGFEIERPAAWDRMEATPGWRELAQQADAVCFGTLAQRSQPSRKTIAAFLKATRPECVRIFDVNLRPPFYSRDTVLDSIRRATIVKFNQEELIQVSTMLGLSVCASPQDLCALATHLAVELLCVTRGNHGSLLATPQQVVEHPGFPVQVVDTVGAGDAFAAAVACCWGLHMGLERTGEVANRWAGWVASQPGAMPLIEEGLRRQMLP